MEIVYVRMQRSSFVDICMIKERLLFLAGQPARCPLTSVKATRCLCA